MTYSLCNTSAYSFDPCIMERIHHKINFKWSTAGLDSKFTFSLTGDRTKTSQSCCLTKAGC